MTDIEKTVAPESEVDKSLTEEEREFLRHHQGGIFDQLMETLGGPRAWSPKVEAQDAASQLVATLIEKRPSRTERLLVISQILEAAAKERDALLAEIMEAEIGWRERQNDGELVGHAFQSFDLEGLASLSGLTTPTIRARQRKILDRTLREAQALKAQRTDVDA